MAKTTIYNLIIISLETVWFHITLIKKHRKALRGLISDFLLRGKAWLNDSKYTWLPRLGYLIDGFQYAVKTCDFMIQTNNPLLCRGSFIVISLYVTWPVTDWFRFPPAAGQGSLPPSKASALDPICSLRPWIEASRSLTRHELFAPRFGITFLWLKCFASSGIRRQIVGCF